MTAEGAAWSLLSVLPGKMSRNGIFVSPGKAGGGLGTARGQAGPGAAREKQEKFPVLGGIWELCWCGERREELSFLVSRCRQAGRFQSLFQRVLSRDSGGSQKTRGHSEISSLVTREQRLGRGGAPRASQGAAGMQGSHGIIPLSPAFILRKTKQPLLFVVWDRRKRGGIFPLLDLRAASQLFPGVCFPAGF